jgi:hypothetical protein
VLLGLLRKIAARVLLWLRCHPHKLMALMLQS